MKILMLCRVTYRSSGIINVFIKKYGIILRPGLAIAALGLQQVIIVKSKIERG